MELCSRSVFCWQIEVHTERIFHELLFREFPIRGRVLHRTIQRFRKSDRQKRPGFRLLAVLFTHGDTSREIFRACRRVPGCRRVFRIVVL